MDSVFLAAHELRTGAMTIKSNRSHWLCSHPPLRQKRLKIKLLRLGRKEVLKIKTFTMDPQDDPAFPVPKWQTTLGMIKESATAGI